MAKRNGGKWTEARHRAFVISALRAAFRRWGPKFDVLRNAATERRINPLSGKLAMHYRCALCDVELPLKQVQVDHTVPVVDVKKGFVNWDTFIDRLYVEVKKLQVLCKPCHKAKSAGERTRRKKK